MLLQCLVLSATLGCQREEPDSCGPAVDSSYRILVQLRQKAPVAGSTTGTYYLACQDNQQYGTGSCQLQRELIPAGNILRLRFCGVGPCGETTDLGPARGAVDLAGLVPQVYQLDIAVRNRRTTGTLDLTATPVCLTVADTTIVTVRP